RHVDDALFSARRRRVHVAVADVAAGRGHPVETERIDEGVLTDVERIVDRLLLVEAEARREDVVLVAEEDEVAGDDPGLVHAVLLALAVAEDAAEDGRGAVEAIEGEGIAARARTSDAGIGVDDRGANLDVTIARVDD